MNKLFAVVAACSLSLVTCIVARGEDFATKSLDNWHQWRGPAGDGLAPRANPPLAWDAETNVKWKVHLPGEGSGTPIVWGDKLFILAAINTDRKVDDPPQPHPAAKTTPPDTIYQFVVLCFNRENGEELWRRVAVEEVPHEGRHETNTYAAASPVTDGEHLFASFGSRGVYCYDLDGELKWKRDLGDMRTRNGWGEATSPLAHAGRLFINWDQEENSFIACLDAASGDVLWKKDRDEPTSWATPLATSFNGREQVIVSGTNRIRAYDPASGDVLWQCGELTVNAIPSPLRYKDSVICMSGYRGNAAHAIPLDATGDISDTESILWSYDRDTPYVPSPLVYGDLVYFTRSNTSVLTALAADSGDVVIDAQRLPELGEMYASPVGAAGRIYLTDRGGTTLVLEQGETVKVLSVNRLGEPVDASPALVGRQLFLRGAEHLFCIEDPKETVRYLRPAGKGFEPETEITRERHGDGYSLTSITQRGDVKLTVASRYDASERLQFASVTLVSSRGEQSAHVTVTDGQAAVTRHDGTVDEFDCPPGVIVTSAPDWTDAFLLAQRFDSKSVGVQEFPGLWIHPTQPPQRLTFTVDAISKLGSDVASVEESTGDLEPIIITLRGGSRYVAWRDGQYRLIRLHAEKSPRPAIVLEGWERAKES